MMVGPLGVPLALASGTSASACTGVFSPALNSSMSPLVEKRCPSRGDSGSACVSRERSRISVLPRLPAARMTVRACTRNCRPLARVRLQSSSQPPCASGRSARTVAPVNSSTPS